MDNGHGTDIAAEVAAVLDAVNAAHHRIGVNGERIHAVEVHKAATEKHLDALWQDHIPALHMRCEGIEQRIEKVAVLIVLSFLAMRLL